MTPSLSSARASDRHSISSNNTAINKSPTRNGGTGSNNNSPGLQVPSGPASNRASRLQKPNVATIKTKQKIQIFISCRDLKNMDMFSQSDPLVAVFMPYKNTGLWKEYARTEWIRDDINPRFATPIVLDRDKHLKTKLRFIVVDVDNRKHDLINDDVIGEVQTTLEAIINADNMYLKLPITANRYQFGTMFLQGEVMSNTKDMIELEFSADAIPKTKWLRKPDSFLVFSRKAGGSNAASEVVVWRTEVAPRTSNPKWQRFKLPLSQWCNGDLSAPINVECYDFNAHRKHTYLGSFHVTTYELCDAVAANAAASTISARITPQQQQQQQHEGTTILIKETPPKGQQLVDDAVRNEYALYPYRKNKIDTRRCMGKVRVHACSFELADINTTNTTSKKRQADATTAKTAITTSVSPTNNKTTTSKPVAVTAANEVPEVPTTLVVVSSVPDDADDDDDGRGGGGGGAENILVCQHQQQRTEQQLQQTKSINDGNDDDGRPLVTEEEEEEEDDASPVGHALPLPARGDHTTSLAVIQKAHSEKGLSVES